MEICKLSNKAFQKIVVLRKFNELQEKNRKIIQWNQDMTTHTDTQKSRLQRDRNNEEEPNRNPEVEEYNEWNE